MMTLPPTTIVANAAPRSTHCHTEEEEPIGRVVAAAVKRKS